MKSPAFSYYEAKDLADAINIKKTDDDAVILAGGQSLLPTLNMRLSNPSVLIDIGKIKELREIKIEGGYLSIGAMSSHSKVMSNKDVNEVLPILCKILSQVAHPAIRNKGTHGGSVAYGDPAAELPAFAVLVDAQIVLSGSTGERIVSAKEFYKGLFETSINPDEILTSVKYPINQNNKQLFFDEITRRHGDYAMAGLVGSIKQKSNINEEINLVFFGTGDKPNEAPKTCEYLLKNEYNYSNIKDILKNDIEFASDISSSSDMKAHLSAILVGRMMKELN
jgi:carbon-monoxide dehydrogenase medium subunit